MHFTFCSWTTTLLAAKHRALVMYLSPWRGYKSLRSWYSPQNGWPILKSCGNEHSQKNHQVIIKTKKKQQLQQHDNPWHFAIRPFFFEKVLFPPGRPNDMLELTRIRTFLRVKMFGMVKGKLLLIEGRCTYAGLCWGILPSPEIVNSPWGSHNLEVVLAMSSKRWYLQQHLAIRQNRKLCAATTWNKHASG